MINFPTPFMRAMSHDGYSKEGADYTITQLLSPPQTSYLATKGEKKDRGIYSKFASFWGTVSHNVIEGHTKPELGEIAERRFYLQMFGVKVGGKIDLIEGTTVYDYKVTGGETTEAKPEHLLQVQMNAFLANENGVPIRTVGVVYIQRDWSYLRSKIDQKYPQSPFKIYGHSYDEGLARRELETRLKEHMEAAAGRPRPCTREEKWQKDDAYALIKPGAKRASKLCKTFKEAETLKKPGQEIQLRKGGCLKCEEFCDYSHLCQQRLAEG